MNRSRKMLWCTLVCALPAFAQSSSVSASTGTFSGTARDSSTLKIVLVDTKDGVRVKEAGYRFIPTGMRVRRVFAENGNAFGKWEGGKLLFQIPVLVKFVVSPNIFEFGGTPVFAWYSAELRRSETAVWSCVLTEIKAPAQEYESQFSLEGIDFGPPPPGKSLMKSYSFTMKPGKDR